MMVVAVLTACPGSGWEVDPAGVMVVHACADLADLLVTAATGVADAALVSADLPGLDRDALARLGALGVAVVGLTRQGDEQAERRLRQLGVADVRPADAADLAEVLRAAVAAAVRRAPGRGFAHAPGAQPARPTPATAQPEPGSGQVVAVWGPTGAPGRTTVAVGLASELALLGWPVLLVDADPYGGAVAASLGLPDESSGLAAACRSANLGVLDAAALSDLVVHRTPALGLLGGASAERWPELRPAGLEVVLALARSLAAVTVVDCGFCLEQDEELSYDTLAPRRNGATVTVLEQADLAVVVGGADPIGLQRLVRGLDELGDAVPTVRSTVVVNKLRASACSGDPEAEARSALRRLAGVEHLTVVPADVEACDAALVSGRPLAEAAPHSPARLALQAFAASLATAPTRRRKGLLRR